MNLSCPHEEVDIMFEEFTTLVSTVGFPIAVSIYLLVRFEKKIEVLNNSISDLTKVITAVMGNQKK
ncbi:YvrJ protein family protein [Clostridium grantii DSM 8605]|uniref:YvrJ protein family protein n=2 Tax=Clostridium TaxID=1485 RepID=A0A1M5RF73_9CLOT|nr:YvrJ protein family protein [Clostridium grantii DSM 8605]